MTEIIIEPEVLIQKLSGLHQAPRAEYETDGAFDPKGYKPSRGIGALLWYEKASAFYTPEQRL